MKDLIERIARALVDSPEEVMVTAIKGNQATVLELKVAKEDLGKIIGKQGRTARSLRTIIGAASAKERKRVVLEIVE
ncbi:MAG: KH domain-containing protein [Deltaproteobacteria bacterium]|nr:KH domain-containing protein [Deltaproteobacteria bacterium]